MNCSFEKFLSLLKNEVAWSFIIIFCCLISLIIIWSTNQPVNWQIYKDPIYEKDLIAIIGGIFSIVATFTSLIQMVQHLAHKSHSPSQKRILKILSVVPIYSITSLLSILFMQSAIYMEFIRSCVEAYVIYCFLLLLTIYLGNHQGVEHIFNQKENLVFPFPFCCFKPKSNTKWIFYFKLGVLQYSWINPICSLIAVILNLVNLYANGQWKFNRAYPYLTIIIIMSQTVALFCLITFYLNVKRELKPFNSLAKFIIIKLIVFFIFWQSVLISGLAALHVLRNRRCNPIIDEFCNGSTTGFTIEQEKILLENVLICIEMFFFSVAHHWIFNWKAYTNDSFKYLLDSRAQNINCRNQIGSDIVSTYF